MDKELEYNQTEILKIWLEEIEYALTQGHGMTLEEASKDELNRQVTESLAKKHEEVFCAILLEDSAGYEAEIMGLSFEEEDFYSLALRVDNHAIDLHSCPERPLPPVSLVVDLVVHGIAYTKAVEGLYEH